MQKTTLPGIRARRMRLGMSVQALADCLHVSRQSCYAWEWGQAAPTAAMLPEIAKVLQCSIDDLFRDEPEKGDEDHGEASDATGSL